MPTARLRLNLLAMFTFLSSIASAQTVQIRFKAVDPQQVPIPFATISVSRLDDSTINMRKVSDSAGMSSFNLLAGKQYKVKMTALNCMPLEKGITVKSATTFTLVGEPEAKEIGGVTVTSSRPLMRQEDDKTIVEPEALAAASTNAYEVLEKTPGIFVDQDGNVYLSSTSPSAIYINGREMKMSTADIATMLKNLPPNSIARIEILRSPSAKYDASGSGGIINIVLKKGVKPGLNGSITTALQQGTYGNQFVGVNLTNNNGRSSTYLNANFSRRMNFESIITDRKLGPDTTLSQDAYTRYQSPAWYVGYGYTTPLSKNFELDFSGNTTYNTTDNHTWNRSGIRKNGSSPFSDNLNRVGNTGYNVYTGHGLEGKLKLDSTGSEWETDLFYSWSRYKTDQVYTNNFYQPSLPEFGGDGSNTGKRHYAVVKSDLKLKMKRRFTMETGFRLSYLDFKSIADYYLQSGSLRSKDNRRSNSFHYDENINAFYLQGSKTLGKDFVLKFGARAENTNMNGQQLAPEDTSFSVRRTDLFPYVYLSKKVMAIAGYELRAYLVYRRTINRPTYEYLNPFARYIDQYMFETGNPALRPQFTNNYEANISVDERPLIAIGVNETTDIFTNVVYQADTSKFVSYRTYDNLGKNKEVYFRALGAIPPGKKYFFVLGTQYNHNFYQGLYENEPLSFKRGTWTFFTYHMLKLGKLSQFTLNGFMRLKGQQQFYELGGFGALNATINRQFFKQKLVVTLSMNDILYTNKNDFSINQGSIQASGTRYADTRRFGINIRYSFGIRKKEEQNNMFNIESPERAN